MSVERIIHILAGVIIMASVAAFYFTRIDWILIIPAFVGLNLFQSAFTGFCPPAIVLKKMGVQSSGDSFR